MLFEVYAGIISFVIKLMNMLFFGLDIHSLWCWNLGLYKYTGFILWDGPNVRGKCEPVGCLGDRLNGMPGHACQCANGFAGEPAYYSVPMHFLALSRRYNIAFLWSHLWASWVQDSQLRRQWHQLYMCWHVCRQDLVARCRCTRRMQTSPMWCPLFKQETWTKM